MFLFDRIHNEYIAGSAATKVKKREASPAPPVVKSFKARTEFGFLLLLFIFVIMCLLLLFILLKIKFFCFSECFDLLGFSMFYMVMFVFCDVYHYLFLYDYCFVLFPL